MAKKNDKSQSTPSIRLKLKAFDHKLIDKSAEQIIETTERYGAEAKGPVPLPTEIKKFTVNKSSFIHGSSKDQYEMRTHKRLIEIPTPTSQIIDALTNLNLPTGVDVEIKTG